MFNLKECHSGGEVCAVCGGLIHPITVHGSAVDSSQRIWRRVLGGLESELQEVRSLSLVRIHLTLLSTLA